LDSGATGLIFSTIETAEQAEEIIKHSCYAPRGNRGLGLVRGNFWGQHDLLADDPILIPQIETKTGVDNLDKIIEFDFDYYLIGPYDLSLSLNVPGKFDNEKFLCYINSIETKIPTEKMAVHIPTDVQRQIGKYKDYGLKCLGMDTIALLEYHKEIVENA
jgi:2-keto-3-deoxy-L-rhamnonate aldolase RhmA